METYAFVGDDHREAYVHARMEATGLQKAPVEEADLIVSCCTHIGALEDAYFESDGLVKRAKEGAYLVDLSGSTPSFSREVSAVCLVNDLHPVEAPLAVVDPFFADSDDQRSNCICFAAGEDDDVAAVMGVLEALASTVTVTGPSGSAQLAKAVHTVQLAAQVVGAVEANALMMRAPVQGSAFGDAVGIAQEGGADRFARRMRAAIEAEDFDAAYTVAMFMSDLTAAMSAADDLELILPHLEAALHLVELLAVIGGPDKGLAALYLLYQDEAAGAAQGLDWSRAEGLFGDENDPDSVYGDDLGYSDDFSGYYEN